MVEGNPTAHVQTIGSGNNGQPCREVPDAQVGSLKMAAIDEKRVQEFIAELMLTEYVV